MRLQELLAGMPVQGLPAAELEVAGIAHDSRRVAPGDLYVALRGQRHDGRIFARQAVARGAVAVLAGGPALEAIEVPWLTAADPRRLLGPVSARLYGHPDRQMALVGVTGTNGKSTVVALVQLILEAAGRPAGRVGTLGYAFRDWQASAVRTTPEASDLFRVLDAMRRRGAAAAAVEVSSHALEMGRVEGASFQVAVFTNLTRDHLDFHRDLEEYFRVKRRLFGLLAPGGRAVVNGDDSYGRRLSTELPGALLYGKGRAVSVREARCTLAGTRATLATPRGAVRVECGLVGRLNLGNLLAAVAVGEALSLPQAAVGEGLSRAVPLPGRMEPVEAGQPFAVLVDYAHTDAALEAALRSLRELTAGRIVLVFGCGGDRDAGKRFLMGRVAGELADVPIVTSDNPRSEDPLAILAAVERGLEASGNRDYRLIPDRRDAIRRALTVATPEDAVLVAGKGHEAVQEVGGEEIPFSDREEILSALEETGGSAKDR